jgi:redox-sensitive bicupin YhaK (pirin superfamily)
MPMLTIRRSEDRGHANHGWLDSYHTFSFADYHDDDHMGFRALRVINEDVIEGGMGFGQHPHRDMEILTYMLEGELAHRDSMGNGSTIVPGEVQGMSAGSGVTHSEFNASQQHKAHLLQIWIMPHTRNVTPAYGEWVSDGKDTSQWVLAASGDGAQGSIRIQQDARMLIAKPKEGATLNLPIAAGRYGWLQVARGTVELDGQALHAGDGASFGGGEASFGR